MPTKTRPKPRTRKAAFIGCTLKELPRTDQLVAARESIAEYPGNAPANAHTLGPQQLVAYTTHYWGPGERIFAVQFLDTTNRPLIDRILSHMNAWAEFTNKSFQFVARDGEVRVALGTEGYWSYLGSQILQVGRNSPTLGLQGFTLGTSEGEYKRVVRHETGHTLGFQHGQLLPATIARLDRSKTIAWFQRYYGWPESQTVANVLTPLDLSQAIGSFEEDPDSIMTYMIPPECFKDGKPFSGGSDITLRDRRDAAKMYPPRVPPPPPQIYPANVFWFAENGGHVWWWNDSGVRFSVEPIPGFKGTLNVAANRKLVVVGAGKGWRPAGAVYDYATGQLLWNNYIPGIPQDFMGGVFPSVIQTNQGMGGHIRWSGYGGLVVEMDPNGFRVFGSEVRNAPVPAGTNYRSLIV